MWGTAENPQYIMVNGQRMVIRRNLWRFLDLASEYRLTDTDSHAHGWFFIDQICIDQTNLKERNHQVQHMADVYRSAREVTVWIDASVSVERHYGESISEGQLDALSRDDYWRRMWIIQELALAKKAILRWRTGTADLDYVALRLEDLGLSGAFLELPEDALDNWTSMWYVLQARETYRQQGGLDWKRVTELIRRRKCEEPRDRVYAMLGLLHRALWAPAPNYAQSLEELFKELSLHALLPVAVSKQDYIWKTWTWRENLGLPNDFEESEKIWVERHKLLQSDLNDDQSPS